MLDFPFFPSLRLEFSQRLVGCGYERLDLEGLVEGCLRVMQSCY